MKPNFEPPLTWAQFTDPDRMIVLRAQERRTDYARNAPQRRAGHCDSEAGGQRSEDRELCRQHWYYGGHVLPVESQVRQYGRERRGQYSLKGGCDRTLRWIGRFLEANRDLRDRRRK